MSVRLWMFAFLFPLALGGCLNASVLKGDGWSFLDFGMNSPGAEELAGLRADRDELATRVQVQQAEQAAVDARIAEGERRVVVVGLQNEAISAFDLQERRLATVIRAKLIPVADLPGLQSLDADGRRALVAMEAAYVAGDIAREVAERAALVVVTGTLRATLDRYAPE